jgi:uncharacterized protein (DUF1015 family)
MPTDGRAPLVMAPFRGLRFDPDVVGDLGTVVSPPYDVLDADTVRDLEGGNGRNIVRLILSRSSEQPYLAVRRRLDQWRHDGSLVPDPWPALYVYQYVVDGVRVRGIIGLVALREEQERIVLPHEDVMPGPVTDRAVLMRATQTNPEPILLVHEGTQRLRDLLADVVRREPLVSFEERDGTEHCLWGITNPETLDTVTYELAPGQALIADGHHRYAAYRRLQQELRDHDAPRGASPWDFGLAMLVDQHDHPLTIGPIHRSLSGITLADVLELSAERGDEVGRCTDREAALAELGVADAERAVFVVSDGRSWMTLGTPRRREVDAEILHSELFPAWHVAEAQVGYHHSLDQALHHTAGRPGIVVGVRPPSLAQVIASAADGRRMPRKSTSFTPKPRMGVVLRDLRDA